MTFDHVLAHKFSRRSALQLAGLGAAALALPRMARGDDNVAAPAVKEPKVLTQPTGFYRAKVGSLETLILSDGSFKVATRPLFAPEASDEQVTQVLRENLAPTDMVSMEFNVICVKIGRETVLIDTGNGPTPTGGPGRIFAQLKAAGVSPDDVTAVIITHAHYDHLGGAVDAMDKPAFKNARVFMSRAEHDFWSQDKPELSGAKIPQEWKDGWITGTHKRLAALKGKLELVKPGDRILDGLELIDTPGHTPGHLSVLISDGADQLLCAADTCHNHILMFAKPDWSIGVDSDPKLAVASRKRLFDRAAADKLRVSAYHLPWPGFGRIGKHRDGYLWVPEPWSWEA
jgi:glyoxylase-like metal-dependent hydrolase (beta-lactamase superfamily II)